MKKFEIKPHKGVNSLEFGMTQKVIRELMGEEYSSRKRTSGFEFPVDFFPNSKMIVGYKTPGVVESFEFSDESEVMLDEVNLFSLSYDELEKFLKDRDPDLKINIVEATSKIDSLTSKKLGVGAWVPDADENEPARSVIVFEPGYYDR